MLVRRETAIWAAGVVALSSLALAAPVAAQQTPTPTPAPAPLPLPTVPPSDRDEMMRRWQFDAANKMQDQANLVSQYRQTVTFAECAQRIAPSRLMNLLDQPLGSPAERRAANTLIRFAPGCLGNTMLVSTRLLRGAAAEAVLENYRTPDPDQAREIQSERMESFLAATPDPTDLKDETAVGLTKLTQCQVLFAPGLSRKLLDTQPESKDEGAVRAKLVEGTTMCGQVEAVNDLSWLIHRSYLAEALYHWTRSSAGFSQS